jgi:hypothetical protein
MERCRREIGASQAHLRAGHQDVEGLCLALADWSAELRLLQASGGLATVAPRLAHVRSWGGGLECGPTVGVGAFRRESCPERGSPPRPEPDGPGR